MEIFHFPFQIFHLVFHAAALLSMTNDKFEMENAKS